MYFLNHRANSGSSAPAEFSGLSRRGFLKSVTAGGGLLIGCATLPVIAGNPSKSPASIATGEALVFNAFVKITPDNLVTVVVKHLDMGQGVSTGLTTLVAEELDASWEQMRWESAPADATRYNNLFWGPSQGTGGSTAIANSWEQLRKAGAAARAMLVAAAAEQWKLPAKDITVNNGLVSHGEKRATFGELAAQAAQMPVPESPALKDPKTFRLIGNQVSRKDSHDKTNGSAIYTQDIQLPGMLTAVVLYPPKLFGKVAKVNATRAKGIPGVVAVVEIPRGVAVVAEGFWPAQQARKLLDVEWDLSGCETRSSEELFKTYSETARQAGHTVKSQGDTAAVLAKTAKVIEAEYQLPFLSHAAIEPMNCVVKVSKHACDLWYGCQMHTNDRKEVAAATGLPEESVSIHTVYAGGSFGRRASPGEYVMDAVAIAKQVPDRPVKMVWTREDDMRNGKFRPMSVHRLRGAVSPEGKLLAWDHHAVAQPILRGTPFEQFIQGPIDGTVVEGIQDMPYDIPNLSIRATEMKVGVSTLWWRSVGHSGHAFVVETFIDQLARAAGQDPVDFRRQMLAAHPRYLGALNLAAERANWGMPLAKGKGRGIAVHKAMGSWCAQVAEVSVAQDGNYSIDRFVCAIDCGIAVNPDVVKAQMEGSIGFALSAALGEAITLHEGRVVQGNFDTYQPMRIADMPKVEVYIVPSAEPPSGVGEPGVPPTPAALANALRDATGRNFHRMPFGRRV